MSLNVCLPGLVEAGKLTPDQAKQISDLYDELVADNATRMGTGAAEAAATREAVEQLDRAAALKARRVGLAARAQAEMTANMSRFAGGGDGPIAARAAEAVLVRDDRAPYLSFEYRWKVIRGQAHALIDKVLVDHHANFIGRIRDKEGFDRITDELHGSKTGDLNASEAADGVRQALEQLRLRANAAGADIGKLENFGLPHSWHSEAVETAGYAAWRDDLWPVLDRARMIDRTTGKPFTDAALEPVLRDVFRAIETGGWSRRTPGGQGGSSLANRMGDHRFLHFKDGASWRAIHEKYGVGTPYDALMGHIDQMSRDVALMETLGPNPAAGLKWLQDSIEKSAAEGGNRAQREGAARSAKKLQTLYDEATGALRDPYNRRVALAFSTIRSWQTATKLGSATLSATTDFATTTLAKGFNGLPQTGTLSAYLKHLNPASAENRAHAIRSGLIAEEFASRTSAQGRYMGEELVGEVSRRVADGVLRASGLNAHTQALRFAFGKEYLAALTLYRTRTWEALPGGFRRSMEMGGIDRADWDGIRATPVTMDRGAEWLDPAKIADRAVGERLMGRILAETDFAVPVSGLETAAMLNSAFKSGTILGELGRTAFQFKSFPVTITMMHARRMMAMSGWRERAGYLAALMILTTTAGAAALQLKEIAKGKDPRPMDDWQFWGAAAAQGGGAGIYGDFLKGSQSRFGQSFSDVAKGPAWATVDTLNSLTLDAIGDAVVKADDPDAPDVKYGGRVVSALRSEVPGGSLWYARLAFERLVLDQVREQIDPNYRRSWRRMEKLAGEQGQEYYWRPGELAPDRAPDFANVGGDE